jgi:RHS repeat-associated protein
VPTAPPPGDIHDFWRDEHGLSSWLQIDFNGPKTIDEIDVFTLRQDILTQADPSPTGTCNNYGITAFDVQYWTGSAWQTVPGGSIPNNNLVWRKLTFTAVTTSKIRVVVVNAAVDGIARICEVEAWTTAGSASATANINWLVADQLGTPRMVFDKTGSLAGTKRHDYLPFGEELVAGQAARTTALGYVADTVRQKFTQKERDIETGLDYFGARYYASTQGRFITADSWAGKVVNPQSLNRYSYVVNNPLKYVDLWGHQGELPKKKGKKGADEDEIPADRENNTDDGECPCPVYVIPAPGPKYIPDSRQIYDDWFDVLRGRFSFGSYMRNAGEFLNQSARNGEAQGQQITSTITETLNQPDVQFALTMTGPGSLLGAEEAASIRVGRWMSQLELDTMLETGFVQLSKTLGVTNVAYPANASAFIKQAEVGSVYVEFNVARSSVVDKGGGWALIPGPNSIYGKLATRQGGPVPQMPRAINIEHKATKISN